MSRDNRVAIVGIGGIFPESPDLGRFWANIVGGVATAREVPRGRWGLDSADAYDPGVAVPDHVYSTRGCFITEFELDPTGFALDADLVARLDPVFHLSLHAARAAWQDAQTEAVDRDRVGVVFGNLVLPTETASDLAALVLGRAFASQAGFEWDFARGESLAEPLNARPAGSPAGLVAQGLGFGGGAYTIDAACASSLYAVKLAADSLVEGRLDAVVCGGVSRPDPLYTQMGFAQLRALSPSGVASPFGAAADGLVVGEGAGMFVLKRLADAEAQGDRIYGVVVGAGVSNDVDGGLLAPSSEGQLRAMRAAYDQAGWQPADVDLIECHATGTPVGDAVEFASLSQLWGSARTARPCVIGSIKSNIGHCLTAAGASGLLKVLLGLKHDTLPPTAGFTGPSGKIDLESSPFQILARAEPWTRRDAQTPRRAAISGFGFGGINAHLLIEEWVPGAPVDRPEPVAAEPIAVVALAAQFGPFATTAAVRQRLLGARADVRPEPVPVATNWGIDSTPDAYRIDAVEVPTDRFRIPPKELIEALPQQLLMLNLASEATEQAGWSGDEPRLRTGVFVGLGLDLNATNFHVRWMLRNQARIWNDQHGLGLDAAGLDAWVNALRESCGPALNANRTMGALGSIVASRLAREFRLGGPSFTVSSEETSGLRALDVACGLLRRGELDEAIVGAVDLATDPRLAWANGCLQPEADLPPGDGAAVLVVKRLADATAAGDSILAIIRASAFATGFTSGREAIRSDGGTPDTFGQVGSDDSAALEWAVGAVGAAGGMAALVRGIAAVATATRPALLTGPSDRSAKFWLRDRVNGPRQRLVRAVGIDETITQVLVEGYEPTATVAGDPAAPSPLGDRPAALFACSGDSFADLIERVDALATHISAEPNRGIEPLARLWARDGGYSSADCLAIALVASDRDDLARQMGAARRRLRAEPGSPDAQEWPGETVALSLDPTGRGAGLAFVFPAMGNQFAGMGRDLAVHWPHILRRQDGENERLRSQMEVQTFWDAEPPASFDDHRVPIFGQVALGTVVADLLRSFGVEPTASIGYSLGESTALFGLRAWTDRDAMYRKFAGSSLFDTDLAGPCDAARQTWRLPQDEPVDWVAVIVAASADQVRAALGSQERAYLLLINTDNECVIGGQRGAIEALVTQLGGKSWPLPTVSTVHCDVVQAVEAAYRDLHVLPTVAPAGVTFYSGASGSPYDLTEDAAADAILAQACATVDFPRLIRRAYADGVRAFVEIGPGASCTRMIGSVLGDQPHLAIAACPSDREPVGAFLWTLARLIAERFPVDLGKLYGPEPDSESSPVDSRRMIRVPVGGPPFCPPAPPVPAHLPDPEPAGRSFEPLLDDRTNPFFAPEPVAMPDPVATLEPVGASPVVLTDLVQHQWMATDAARAGAHSAYLRTSGGISDLMARQIASQMSLIAQLAAAGWDGTTPRPNEPIGWLDGPNEPISGHSADAPNEPISWPIAPNEPISWPIAPTEPIGWPITPTEPISGHTGHGPNKPIGTESTRPNEPIFAAEGPPRVLDRAACLRFAVGAIGDVLGPDFAAIDAYPTRVRLPDEPLMLVDRITAIEGEPLSMGSGRVVTEHDIHPGAWYLDAGVIPTCIAVESGQADLFLSAFLGIDFETKGLAVYRLLDAVVSFDQPLPGPGSVIVYDIHIDRFFRQGESRLFRFRFTATVDREPLMTMSDGIAGFFTEAALAAGQGVVKTALDLRPIPGIRPDDWDPPVPMRRESLSDNQVEALRAGDLVAAFGASFGRANLAQATPLPGGLMRLVDRVVAIEPDGGRYGIGLIRAEADIDPAAWFMTCHFVDDQVMPGTLMFECCLHTLRIYLMRMGWIGELGEVVCHPVPGVQSRLKCRGQVVASTKKVTYEVEIREIGFRPEPYAIVDALMYADGKPIVEITSMSLRMVGLDREKLQAIWAEPDHAATVARRNARVTKYDAASIRAFAVGKPSEAFGVPYRVFDHDRVIARLPGPPYQFLDRVIETGGEPWVMAPGSRAVAEYDVPADAWYFDADRGDVMPFAVLLEAALQPCGWLAAYMGSALTSDVDLSFRNLGGSATQFEAVGRDIGTLRTEVTTTKVSKSGGMIIQGYNIEMTAGGRPIYRGETTFGFFSKAALSNQVGIREAVLYQPIPAELARATAFPYPTDAPYPDDRWRMIDHVAEFIADGGPNSLGYVRGTLRVDPAAWFFAAHFYQDPVVPGSLGLESFQQLLKVVASERWGLGPDARFESVGLHDLHRWTYRGQILPTDSTVTTRVVVTEVDDAQGWIKADGFLDVDGRVIYGMNDFTLRATPGHAL